MGGERWWGESEAEAAEAVRKAGAKYLFHDQPDYPALLGQLDSAPPILIWRGDLALAARPCVAMVGARNASAAAVKLARTELRRKVLLCQKLEQRCDEKDSQIQATRERNRVRVLALQTALEQVSGEG